MKKLFTILSLLFSLATMAQMNTTPEIKGYLAAGVHSGGVTYGGGVMINNVDIALHYRRPFSSNVDPKTLAASIGYEVGDRFSITPSVGWGAAFYNDYSKYDVDEYGAIEKKQDFVMLYAVELAWNFQDGDAHAGRLSYKPTMVMGKAYHGILLRYYFKYQKN